MKDFENSENFKKLSEEAKHIYFSIIKQHDYFRDKDEKYKKIVKGFKIVLLSLSMLSTVILGMKTVIDINLQVVLALILSSLISFTSSLSSYFNFEKYWMRNISIHINLNIIRDEYIIDVLSNGLDNEKLKLYKEKLTETQMHNIKYWEDAIKKI